MELIAQHDMSQHGARLRIAAHHVTALHCSAFRTVTQRNEPNSEEQRLVAASLRCAPYRTTTHHNSPPFFSALHRATHHNTRTTYHVQDIS
jgi:hypothetical protein